VVRGRKRRGNIGKKGKLQKRLSLWGTNSQVKARCSEIPEHALDLRACRLKLVDAGTGEESATAKKGEKEEIN